MPSPAANRLTVQHRAQLDLIARLIASRVTGLAVTAVLADIDRWWETNLANIAALVAEGNRLSAVSALRYLEAHAATEDVLVRPEQVTADRGRLETSLTVTGPTAFKISMRANGDPLLARRAMTQQLRGASTRLVLAGSRDTTTATVDLSPQIVGQRRVSAGSPCAFCAMVISRGAVYKADGRLTAQFHDHDRCTYEPLYQNEPEPSQVVALRDKWQQSTDGLGGVDALNAFRRSLQAVP